MMVPIDQGGLDCEKAQAQSEKPRPCDDDDGDICTPKSEPSTDDDQPLD